MQQARYPGIRVVSNGNHLVAYHTEARVADAGIFYPITPSTEMGELFQLSFAEGKLNVFGRAKIAIEAEGEHAAQGGAIAFSATGKRVVNFTSGQGIVYGSEQYYHAPGKLATMVLEVAARALTKHALNVHCGHDDIYAALDTGWTMLMGRDAQQAADQALIARKVAELSLTPAMNIQDGFLTSHLERTFFMHEAELIREFLGSPDDVIPCPTDAQRELFGPSRIRVPSMIDLKRPALIGPVQNQEHYMNGVVARRNNFCEPILGMLEEAYREFGELTGRHYGLLSEYKADGADTVFLSLGSAAENIEAAVDYIEQEHGERVGSIHVNVLRPFPLAAIANALRGRKNVIILERTDEALSSDNPLARDVRTALSRSLEVHKSGKTDGHPAISADQMPRIFSGSYGLGSRDFRPEGILGAWEYATGRSKRTDGRCSADGENYFTVGIDHPYAVQSSETPSLLPDQTIAVRLHSIGGWGMITTGKNLGAIIGEFGDYLSHRDGAEDAHGQLKEVLHVSANPKYGSEKKGAPTAYFLMVAPERIRVNCDLRHVNVVLCCDPKAFTHMNPLDGMADGGAFVWESDESPETAWTRVPQEIRQEITDRKIRLFILPGFDIAKAATDRPDLQLRMQGNAFLGAFFHVSPFLENNDISKEHFNKVVLNQYQKKFGRFGDAVVESNMEVMTQGFERVQEVPYGDVDADDASTMRGTPLLPVVNTCGTDGRGCGTGDCSCEPARNNLQSTSYYDREYRSGLGYHQPASPLSAVGVVAAATGASNSKYVARRDTPVFIAENCTQCMACITACPDTALPNTAQDISTVLTTAIDNYISDSFHREMLTGLVPELEPKARDMMRDAVKEKKDLPFVQIIGTLLKEHGDVPENAREELMAVLELVPLAYRKTNAIFGTREKKEPGAGGLFSIFVSDLCKGCAECVTECGDHEALVMRHDSEEQNSRVIGATTFMDLLPETEQKYLGMYDNHAPQDSRPATLRNHLMVQRNYQALLSGDGACAGCGEKSVLRAVATLTESYMRPLYHDKADRLEKKAAILEQEGAERLARMAEDDPEQYALLMRALTHIVMGLGGETDEDTSARIEASSPVSNEDVANALVVILRQEAHNHRDLQAVDGATADGMSVMAMGAHTGCNTVYGSTSPSNPHPYPWMNSLFQDGATVTWLIGESFIVDHARRSVIPERLTDLITGVSSSPFSKSDYFDFCHFTDTLMTDLEIRELPKVWAIGGDGGMGDIGYQNVSKVVLQNRPNVLLLMLDTQVYSNTGGQNSDSSVLTGGFDMNQIGAATQGKLTERKSVAETFTSGHGSAFVAQISMADQPRFFKAILDALEYRGTAFFQCFTTCQPEHGVGDDVATIQAKRVRDSRGMPQFVHNPQTGESYHDAIELAGNPSPDRDWREIKSKSTGNKYSYTAAHWAFTEARFRRHWKKVDEADVSKSIHLDDLLACVTQNDVVNRRFLNPDSQAFVPDWGVWSESETENGKPFYAVLSRQMVLFCIERRKAWRLLQSKAGVVNKDYGAQRKVLELLEKGEIERDDVHRRGRELLAEHR
ncbi:MAG: oxidoreductase [Fuerstiella sp.]|nr:oxidoreductase [Fuerstiella sp.]MCP4856731.1 oxidoreductase [Fuerstiella sp.]